MNRRNWQDVYGGVPEEFHSRLVAMLNGLEEEKYMKKGYKLSAALIAAIIVALLLAGAALAARELGIFRLLTNRAEPIAPLEGAEQMVATDLGTVENALVRLSVEEAVYDGQGALVQLCIAPKDAEHFAVMSTFVDPSEEDYEIRPVSRDGGYTEQVLGRRDGRADIYCGVMITLTDAQGGEIFLDTWDGELREDGSLAIWGKGFAQQPLQKEVTMHVQPRTVIYGEWDDAREARERMNVAIDALEISMERSEPERQVRYAPVDDGVGEGFAILGAQIWYTRLCAYLDLRYAYERTPDEEMGIDFYLYGGDGEKLLLGGGFGWEEDNMFHILRELQSFDEPPETLVFEARVIGEDRKLGRVECKIAQEE